MIKLAINGFGRIGRTAFKIAIQKPEIEIVAVNDLADAATLSHLLTFDSNYGVYHQKVTSMGEALLINGKRIEVLNIKEPEQLPWAKMGVDVVVESTGKFTDAEGAQKHLTAGAKKVIISAPSKGGHVPTYVMGVNDQKYHNETIISNASCTTNCIAPVAAVIHTNFKILKGMMTTVHAYTADQNLQDGPHKDLRRARAAGYNIVPTTTGAALTVGETIPEIKGKFDGMAIRVPVPVGSISDFVFVVGRKTTVNEINNALIQAAQNPIYKNILTVTNTPIVSTDIIGNPYSAIVDLSLTKVVEGDLVKVVAWYDNEWGYSNRLVEQVLAISGNK
jgi:glyceraldehyde 3-phosphate dehydrogenase